MNFFRYLIRLVALFTPIYISYKYFDLWSNLGITFIIAYICYLIVCLCTLTIKEKKRFTKAAKKIPKGDFFCDM